MTGARQTDAGFGLLEAIVALAIASLALTALYRSLGGAIRAAGRVQEHEAALVLARSHFDSLGSDGFLQVGTSAGAYANGLAWRLNVSTLSTKTSDTAATYRPYWLALEVFDRSRTSLLKLETAKVAREAQ